MCPLQIRQQEGAGTVVWTNPRGLPVFRSSETEVCRGILAAVVPMPKRVGHKDLVQRGDEIQTTDNTFGSRRRVREAKDTGVRPLGAKARRNAVGDKFATVDPAVSRKRIPLILPLS